MDKIRNKKIVLIGGAGFIGHNLALYLKSLGAQVSIVDNLLVNNLLTFTSTDTSGENSSFYLNILNQRLALLRNTNIPIYIQDARDYHATSKLLVSIKPQVIVQLAAIAHANRSNKDPYSTFDHSLRTLENTLDASKSLNIEHFIYFSSSMVYGHFKEKAVTEETPCEPLGIYGALKFAGEKLVVAYNQTFDIPYTIVRPSALYGERCVSRRVGQIFIENAINNTNITITGDGSDSLDFTYINDLTHGIAKIIESSEAKGHIFNLTYGESRSLSFMANIIKEHFPTASITYKPKDKLTPNRGTLSVDKAKRIIGYNPSWPLEKGFIKYINWYKENINTLKRKEVFGLNNE